MTRATRLGSTIILYTPGLHFSSPIDYHKVWSNPTVKGAEMLINEIAKMAGLSKDGIRHYEELGLITSTPRQAGSRTYREYDLSVVKTIENIRALQRLGLSLNEIGPLFKISAAGYTKKTVDGIPRRAPQSHSWKDSRVERD